MKTTWCGCTEEKLLRHKTHDWPEMHREEEQIAATASVWRKEPPGVTGEAQDEVGP